MVLYQARADFKTGETILKCTVVCKTISTAWKENRFSSRYQRAGNFSKDLKAFTEKIIFVSEKLNCENFQRISHKNSLNDM